MSSRPTDTAAPFVGEPTTETRLWPYPGERQEKQENVVVDLGSDEAEIWSNVRHKVRKNVKRAQRGANRQDYFDRPFCVGRRILHAECYQQLTDARMAQAAAKGADGTLDGEFFPAYRAPI